MRKNITSISHSFKFEFLYIFSLSSRKSKYRPYIFFSLSLSIQERKLFINAVNLRFCLKKLISSREYNQFDHINDYLTVKFSSSSQQVAILLQSLTFDASKILMQ